MDIIFVIDDDNDLLNCIKSLLSKTGFLVTTFIDWEIAYQAMKKCRPQLILLDVFLGKLDGLDICKKLKASPFTNHIPVLMCSAFPKIAESAIEDYGAEDFLAKPFAGENLINKVLSILSKKRSLAF